MLKSFAIVLGTTGLVFAMGMTDDNSNRPAPKKLRTPTTPTVIVAPNDKVDVAPVGQMSKIWIGVRCAPVTEALASHLGRGGLMIANVSKDSPADKAGVERHDVIVSLNGESVDSMDDLVSAIEGIGSGKTGKLVVLRSGREKTLEITPADRPALGTVEFKYEEPQAPDADQDVQYFGQRLKRDPFGNWMLQPLGKMHLPDDVRDHLGDLGGSIWRDQQDMLKTFMNRPFSGKIQVDPDDPSGGMIFFPDDEATDAQVEIHINVSENGEQTNIRRGADGKVTVQRKLADGDEVDESFDNMDDFREKAPDAYKTYRRFSGYRSRPTITLPPEWKDLPGLQNDFQEKLESSLQRIREQTQRAIEETNKARETIRMRVQPGASGGSHVFESVNLNVDDSGKITLKLQTNDGTKTYEFRNRDEFERTEPELYKRYESLIGPTPSGAKRTQSNAIAMAAVG
jgi:hypothetical protein